MVQPVKFTPATMEGNTHTAPEPRMEELVVSSEYVNSEPETAPPTVTQEGGEVGGGEMKERGQVAESEISCLIQERKVVTLAMTEGAPV